MIYAIIFILIVVVVVFFIIRNKGRRESSSTQSIEDDFHIMIQNENVKLPSIGFDEHDSNNPMSLGYWNSPLAVDSILYDREYFKSLPKKQNVLFEKMNDICNNQWSIRQYSISFPHPGLYAHNQHIEVQENINVGVLFKYCFSEDTSLDYKYCPFSNISIDTYTQLLIGGYKIPDSDYGQLVSFIKQLSDKPKVLFVNSACSTDVNDDSPDGTADDFHFSRFKKLLIDNGIPYCNCLEPADKIQKAILDSGLIAYDVILIRFASSTTKILHDCEELLKEKRRPRSISYITIVNKYDSSELASIIATNKELLQQSWEAKKQEEAKRKQATSNLVQLATSWGRVPNSDLPHTFLLRYYPTTCEFEASPDEWHDRNLVWGFKNDPTRYNRTSQTEALEELRPLLLNRLRSTFGDLLPEITLVCVPASSPEKNKARYEHFSDELCHLTGMNNAYPHMSLNGRRMAQHEGGEAIDTGVIEFDSAYFIGKNILLFDDVLTSGRTIRVLSNKLSSLGANIIACITIGKTFHHRIDSGDSSWRQTSVKPYEIDAEIDDMPF